MQLQMFLTIISKNIVGAVDRDVYPVNFVKDLKDIEIPNTAIGFDIYYKIVQKLVIDGHEVGFSCALPKKETVLFGEESVRAKQKMVANALMEMRKPVIEAVVGKTGAIRRRLVERHFEFCHPELEVFEERELPSIDYFLLPKSYEKAELFEEYCYPLIVDGKQRLMRSQPLFKETYYVGTIEKADDKCISFKTLKGGLGFAKPEDIIVDPGDIDDLGRIVDVNKKL